MRVINPFGLPGLFKRARASAQYAVERGAPGMDFDRFGRKLGRQLALRGMPIGFAYWLVPVSSVRYFEFPFALASLPRRPGRFLDVSSPRLFGLFVAASQPQASITMINPDGRDIRRTETVRARLGLANVRARQAGVEALAAMDDGYDCVWSISVLEHINGEWDDRRAIKAMFERLAPGGRLILTVPVDRSFREEYRIREEYAGKSKRTGDGRYFFQRLYDEAAIHERLLSPIGATPSRLRWFGEITPGRFNAYVQRWRIEGLRVTVDDPREIADHFAEFPNWEAMPGMGVCGMMIQRGFPPGEVRRAAYRNACP